MSRKEQELIGDYEMVGWVLGNMAAHCGFPTERDTGIAGMMLPVAERCRWFAQFQRLWTTYTDALGANTYEMSREDRQANEQAVADAYQALSKLAREG